MSEVKVISKAQIESIIKEIEAKRTGKKGAEEEFCKYWPAAKIILEILRQVPVLSIIAGILIAVGNAYAEKNCKI